MDPEHIIKGLEALGDLFNGALLCVVFEDHTDLVFSRDEDRLTALRALITAGGCPVCYLYQRQRGRQLEVVARPLQALEDQEGIDEYLTRIGEWFRGVLVKYGKTAAPRGQLR
jgi:hypothetical protein